MNKNARANRRSRPRKHPLLLQSDQTVWSIDSEALQRLPASTVISLMTCTRLVVSVGAEPPGQVTPDGNVIVPLMWWMTKVISYAMPDAGGLAKLSVVFTETENENTFANEQSSAPDTPAFTLEDTRPESEMLPVSEGLADGARVAICPST